MLAAVPGAAAGAEAGAPVDGVPVADGTSACATDNPDGPHTPHTPISNPSPNLWTDTRLRRTVCIIKLGLILKNPRVAQRRH